MGAGVEYVTIFYSGTLVYSGTVLLQCGCRRSLYEVKFRLLKPWRIGTIIPSRTKIINSPFSCDVANKEFQTLGVRFTNLKTIVLVLKGLVHQHQAFNIMTERIVSISAVNATVGSCTINATNFFSISYCRNSEYCPDQIFVFSYWMS